MNHIKPYKLFESSTEDIISYIHDILLELEDIGFNINIIEEVVPRLSNSRGVKIKILITKLKSNEYTNFKLSDIEDPILSCEEYMNSIGFSVKLMSVVNVDYTISEYTLLRFISKPMRRLYLNFYK